MQQLRTFQKTQRRMRIHQHPVFADEVGLAVVCSMPLLEAIQQLNFSKHRSYGAASHASPTDVIEA